MTTIDRVKAKYMEQNPGRREQFAAPDDWMVALCAVLDEIVQENRRLENAVRKISRGEAV